MATRQRMTWKSNGKTASPPPQMPAVDRTEGPDHPAYYKDPEKDKYENGDTSSWAEDPKKPMIPESAPPAMPGNLTTEPLEHPATSDFEKGADKPGKAAASKEATLTQLAERRASLCVRIASALMPTASAMDVENKALQLMDLEDHQLQATAATLKLVAGDEDQDEAADEDDDKDASKKANHDVTARLDKLENSMNRLVSAMTDFFSKDKKAEDEMTDDEMMAQLAQDMDGDGVDQNKADAFYTDKKAEEDEEAMLKAMLDEMDSDKAASHAEDVVEPLAKGKDILSGEGGNVSPDPAPVTPEVAGPMTGGTAVKAGEMPDFIQKKIDEKEEKEDDKEEKKASEDDKEEDSENDIEITAGEDPMGLMETTASADDELMSLYNDLDLKTAGEEDEDVEEIVEEVEEEPEEDVEASKKAASTKTSKQGLRPQPKVASKGNTPKTVGTVQASRTASQREMADLEKLWETAPDVSSYFGTTGPR